MNQISLSLVRNFCRDPLFPLISWLVRKVSPYYSAVSFAERNFSYETLETDIYIRIIFIRKVSKNWKFPRNEIR